MLVLLVDIVYIYFSWRRFIHPPSGAFLEESYWINYSSIKFDLNIIYFSGHVTCRAGIISIIDQIGVFYL